jgi:hypothetical protein
MEALHKDGEDGDHHKIGGMHMEFTVEPWWWKTLVTPGFKAKTRCSSYVCPGSSFHTYGQNVNTENQCLYYISIITWDIVFTQKTISTLSSRSSGTKQPPQAIDRGQHKLLEEIFIVLVHLIFNFWAALQQGWVDLWLLLSKCRKNNDMQAYNKKGLIRGSIVEKSIYT